MRLAAESDAHTIAARSGDLHVDLALNKPNVTRLQRVRGYPAVSILLASGSTSRQTRTRLAELVQTATARLLGEFSRPAVQRLVDDLTAMADTAKVGPGHPGLALYANRHLAAAIVLPFAARDRVVIDETFATRDLVHGLLRSPRCQVLVLGGDITRLYTGVGATLTEVTGNGFPVLGAPDPPCEPTRLGIDRSDVRDTRQHRQLQAVDTALAEHLYHNQPLLVVGAGRRLSLFRQRSHHRARITQTVPGSFERRSTSDLAQLIGPPLGRILEQRHHEALAELDRAAGARRYASGIDHAWASANEGRCTLAVVEENYTYAARIEPDTNRLVYATDVEHPDVVDDVADEIIEIVLAKGGRVAIVPDGTIAAQGHIAMALRH